VARELAAALGFEPLGLGHPYALRLRVAVGRDRAPGFGQEDLMAFHKIAEPGTFAYAEGNTPDGEALLFLLRAVAGVARSASLAFDPLAADAVTMLFAGRDEEFLADMEAQAVARPHDADLHRLVARLRLNAGRTAEAAEHARTAVTRWPDDADSWSLSAEVRMATGAYAEAIRELRRSLRIDPVQPYVLGLLARCHDELGEAGQAAEARARALSLGG
jgi:Flp pilus assembly protein TadD